MRLAAEATRPGRGAARRGRATLRTSRSGPWEWDVERLSASLVIAGRANGVDDAERARIVSSTVRSYREAMIRFALPRRRGPPLSHQGDSRPE